MVFDYKAYKKAWWETPVGIRSRIKANWKRCGIIHNQGLDYLYDNIYLPATHCEKCNIDFGLYGDGSGRFKSCDHNHAILDSHNFRAVLCHACNVNDNSRNKSGVPNVMKDKNGYRYRKCIKGVTHFKYFKTKQQAIDYIK